MNIGQITIVSCAVKNGAENSEEENMSYTIEMYYKGSLVFRFPYSSAQSINDVEIFRGSDARDFYNDVRRNNMPYTSNWSIWSELADVDLDRLRLFLMPIRKMPNRKSRRLV